MDWTKVLDLAIRILSLIAGDWKTGNHQPTDPPQKP